MIELLRDDDGDVRTVAVKALEKLGAREAISHLIELLGDEKEDVRQASVTALGELWRREDIPRLIELLGDDDRDVRRTVIKALGELWRREDIPRLIELLGDDKEYVRRASVTALGELGAQEAIPGLIELLEDENEVVRQASATALGELGAREAISGLIQRLRDDDRDVRRTAVKVLEKLGAQEAIPGLIMLLGDEDEDVRQAAAKALGKVSSDEAIPLLLLFYIEEGRNEIREILVDMLHESIPISLEPLRFHPDGWVRKNFHYLYETLRRSAGWPRGSRDISECYPSRAALLSIVRLGEEASKRFHNQSLIVQLKAQAYRRLGCPAIGFEYIISYFDTSFASGHSHNVRKIQEFVKGILEKAECLYEMNRFEEALILARQVQDQVMDEPDLLTKCAALLERLIAVDEAEALYTMVIKLDDRAGYFRNRAFFYITRNRFADAEADIARAEQKEPWHPNTFGRKGQLSMARGQYDDALGAFDEACRRDPHNVERQYCLAFANFGLDRSQQAMEYLNKAVEATELHEQVESALQNLELLARSRPDLKAMDTIREHIMERKLLLDQIAKDECLGLDTISIEAVG